MYPLPVAISGFFLVYYRKLLTRQSWANPGCVMYETLIVGHIHVWSMSHFKLCFDVAQKICFCTEIFQTNFSCHLRHRLSCMHLFGVKYMQEYHTFTAYKTAKQSLCSIEPASCQWFKLIVGHKPQCKWSLWSNQLMFWKQQTIIFNRLQLPPTRSALCNSHHLWLWWLMGAEVQEKAKCMYSVSSCLAMEEYMSQSWAFGSLGVQQAAARSRSAWIIEILPGCWSYPSASPGRVILLWEDSGWGKHTRIS